MAFLVENNTASPLVIADLGITIAAGPGTTYDLALENPKDVAESAQVGNDLWTALNATNASILDPLDDVTPLSGVDSIAAAQAANDTHWRIKGGELNQLDDVNAPSPNAGEGLVYGGTTWDPQPVALDVPRSQIYFVGKHGNDSNTGLTPDKAKLTFTNAISTANAQTPSSSNRWPMFDPWPAVFSRRSMTSERGRRRCTRSMARAM